MIGKLFLIFSVILTIILVLTSQFTLATTKKGFFRPPAVPLVTFDPYLSVWSEGTYLANHATVHWTGTNQDLVSLIRIDGKTYRLMGDQPKDLPALKQTNVEVFPLESIYYFEGDGISVKMSFLSPRLPSDLETFSLPISYITWNVHSIDDHAHKVQIYYSTSSQLAVNTFDEKVNWKTDRIDNLIIFETGASTQDVLGLAGDRVRINWGYIYTVASSNQATGTINENDYCQESFIRKGILPSESIDQPKAVDDGEPVEAIVLNLGEVKSEPILRYVMVGLNERYVVNYFGTYLRPYWMHWYSNTDNLFMNAFNKYNKIYNESVNFDQKVMSDCKAIGGLKYAQICSLAYRQALAGIGMAEDSNGQPLLFTKENTSNGDISTVDVIYPTSPIFLLFNPDLLKGMLVPILDYSESPLWNNEFAPHDLGTYPNALGHFKKLGDIGEQMPVEETGNMLIMMDAIAQAEGNADFALKYWPLLTKWANYLLQNGFDPGNQLCTDDFAGPMPHNANLSIKSIEAIGAYAQMCQMIGEQKDAQKYLKTAKDWAKDWATKDISSDDSHYLLGFESSENTWSQKYNLVWDKILNLNLFPANVINTETNYYLTKLQKFGLPLDSRQLYTKTDWTIWTASLKPQTPYFHILIDLVYKFLDETPNRVPMADFYWTQSGYQAGMFARPVVGAAFITMLTDKEMWNQWVKDAQKINGNWASLPKSYFLLEPLE